MELMLRLIMNHILDSMMQVTIFMIKKKIDSEHQQIFHWHRSILEMRLKLLHLEKRNHEKIVSGTRKLEGFWKDTFISWLKVEILMSSIFQPFQELF